MYEQHQSNHGLHIGSMLVGIAAGVAGTILYATYKEREFNQIVGKTRDMSDRSAEYLGNVGGNVKDKAVALMDSAENAVSNLNDSVRKMTHRDKDAIPSAT